MKKRLILSTLLVSSMVLNTAFPGAVYAGEQEFAEEIASETLAENEQTLDEVTTSADAVVLDADVVVPDADAEAAYPEDALGEAPEMIAAEEVFEEDAVDFSEEAAELIVEKIAEMPETDMQTSDLITVEEAEDMLPEAAASITIYLDPNGGEWEDGTTAIKTWTGNEMSSTSSNPFEWDCGECEREDYAFNGWTVNQDGSGNIYDGEWTEITAELDGKTLYAAWEAKVEILFDFNGGLLYDHDENGSDTYVCTAYERIPVECDFDEYTSPDAAYPMLQGWKDDNTGDIYYMDLNGEVVIPSPYEDMNLTAIWAERVTITFNILDQNAAYAYMDSNNGHILTYEIPVGKGTRILPDKDVEIIRDSTRHAEFIGWSLEKDGSKLIYERWNNNEEVTITESINLYAVIREYYYVSAHLNGGHVMAGLVGQDFELLRKQVYAGNAFKLTANDYIPKEGSVLLGWALESGSYKIAYTASQDVPVTKDMDLYAVWNTDVPKQEPENKPQPAKTGTTLSNSNASYKVLSGGNITFTAPKNKDKAAKVTIPDTVTINGFTYKVTKIESKAFKGAKKLKTVTIGANVTEIGKSAFQDAKALKTLTIKSKNLKKIGSKAFLKAGSSNYKKLTVKVPKAKKKEYTKLLQKAKLSKKAKIK